MTNGKKILYLITKSNFGGAQRYIFDLAQALKNTDEVCVGAGGDGILFKKLKGVGIRTISIPFLERDVKIWNEPQAILEIIAILKKETPNIVHLNSSKIGLLGGIATRIYNLSHTQKIKTIFTIHGFPFKEPRGIIWKTTIYIATWLSLLLCDENIVVSAQDKKTAENMFFVSYKTHLIENGITPTIQITRDAARIKLLGKNTNKITIGTIAELHPNKGLSYLLQALSYIKDESVQCVIVGDGEKREELKEYANSLHLSIPVIFTGFIDNASSYLSAFDIFILPSLKEGLPYAILEAGAAKLPVIASNVGGIPEIIENGISGTLVPPKDPKSLALAIELYLQDPHLAQEHAHNLQKRVTEKFNSQNMVEKTTALYK